MVSWVYHASLETGLHIVNNSYGMKISKTNLTDKLYHLLSRKSIQLEEENRRLKEERMCTMLCKGISNQRQKRSILQFVLWRSNRISGRCILFKNIQTFLLQDFCDTSAKRKHSIYDNYAPFKHVKTIVNLLLNINR